MSKVRTKRDQLVEEFHVQVFSSGRIAWDSLDGFIAAEAVDRRGLMAYVQRRLEALGSVSA